MWSYLGQNFLRDNKYKTFIVENIKKAKEKYKIDRAIEIWPWKWAITKHINFFQYFTIFEKDTNFQEKLENLIWKENIEWWDFLEQNLDKKIEWNFIWIWNIPYYITSPILRKVTHPNNKNKMIWGIFMIQKEVWEKIKVWARKKSYLRWLLNYNYEVKYLKTVPAKSFSPAPRVDSCLVWLISKETRNPIKFEDLLYFLNNFSAYKRKTLAKILKMLAKKDIDISKFQLSDENKKKRIEDLGREDLKKILN